MFSSMAIYGNMGQTNYSASNSFLDALARHRCALGRHTVAMRWGAWGEVGMAANLDAALKRRFEQSAMPPFKTADGIKGFERGLKTGAAGFMTALYNPKVMADSIKQADTTAQCYQRNFFSEMIGPTPQLPSLERKHIMSVYRMCKSFYSWNTSNDWLVWFWTVNKGIFQLDEDAYDPEKYTETGGYKWPVDVNDEGFKHHQMEQQFRAMTY